MTDARQWMPLHIGSYLKNTQRLTTEQHGAYLLLLMEYWNEQGPLPDDDEELSLVARMSIDVWKAARPKLQRFFSVGDGLWRHLRVDEEISRAQTLIVEKAERMAKVRAAKAAKKSAAKTVTGTDTDSSTEVVTGPDTNAVSVSTTQPPIPLPSPSPGSKEPLIVSLGEEFWKEYPHPPNRGAKSDTIKKINKLPPAEQEAAIAALPLQRNAIAEQRKSNPAFQPCMASVFVNQKRWEGLLESQEEIVSRENISTTMPDDPVDKALAEKLIQRIGKDKFASWFQPPPRKNCKGYIVCADTQFKADMIENRFGGVLNDTYGKGQWRIEG